MAETVLNQEEQKLDTSIDGQRQNHHLKKIIVTIFAVIFIVSLVVFIFNLQNQNYRLLLSSNELLGASTTNQATNYRSYVKQYKDTKQQLEETVRKLEIVKQQLDQVTIELSATKGMLSETQNMLAQAQADNAKLKQEIQGLEGLRPTEITQSIPELESKISTLKAKNLQVASELSNLKSEMRAFEADFANMDEGRSLITLFQNKIKLVKSRMRYLKQETYFTKVAAQKERDRIEALNGNSGFLVRGGQVNKSGDTKGFSIDVKILQ